MFTFHAALFTYNSGYPQVIGSKFFAAGQVLGTFCIAGSD